MFFKHFFKNKRIYLDYASSTPYDTKMFKSLTPIPQDCLGVNPSALHREAVELKKILEADRKAVADIIFAHPGEIIFTSGATESNNIAIQGLVKNFVKNGIKYNEIAICTTDMEHSSISEQIKYFVSLGVRQTELYSENLEDIKVMIFSIIYVNNETGQVSPIKEIAKHVRSLRKESVSRRTEIEFIFHIDATQAPLFYELRVDRLGVDLMTLGATKLYTHKGVGLLYKKRNIKLEPIILGGGQEMGLRAGTESVDLIHHFTHAFIYAQKNIEKYYEKIKSLQEYFENKIKKEIPEAVVTAQDSERSPHISHIAIPKIDSELLVLELDARGIAVSSKSACKNDQEGQSDIIEILYGKDYGAVRFSFGKWTTKDDLDKAIFYTKKIIEKYKSI